MKLTISETITKEVELILPCWRKTATSYYYIAEGFCLEVMNLEKWVYIGTSTEPSIQALNDSKAITYEEFWEAYENAIKKLYEKINTGVRYEFQINEGSIYIDEIVNGKANRQFRLKVASEEVPAYVVVGILSDWYNDRGVCAINPNYFEEYAMFHKDKWEEVPE